MNQFKIKKSISFWVNALTVLSVIIGTAVSKAQTKPEDILEISAGGNHTCVLTKEKVHCWGDNEYGQSGIIRGYQNPRSLTSSADHNCLIDDEGVWCWGNNNLGRKRLNSPIIDFDYLSNNVASFS